MVATADIYTKYMASFRSMIWILSNLLLFPSSLLCCLSYYAFFYTSRLNLNIPFCLIYCSILNGKPKQMGLKELLQVSDY